MIEYRCPACLGLAFSAAHPSHCGGCPSCGAVLEVIGAARNPYTSPREPKPEEMVPLYSAPGQMNASVRAANARRAV
jgi:hypothetical protein